MDSFEDQLATAFVAKMAGQTLKQVDDFTTHRVGVPATRIDPASFLTSIQERKRQEKQREMDELNNLAEKMYPLPEPIQPLPPIQQPTQPLSQQQTLTNTFYEAPTSLTNTSEIVEVLKSLDSTLKEFVEYFRVSVNGVKK